MPKKQNVYKRQQTSKNTMRRADTICPKEDDEQAVVFQWAEIQCGKWPELESMFAVPNGEYRPIVTAARLKAQGVKSGVSDIILPLMRCGYGALAIEMKRMRGGQISSRQKEWMTTVTDQGWLAVVCKGAESAIATLSAYLDGRLIRGQEHSDITPPQCCMTCEWAESDENGDYWCVNAKSGRVGDYVDRLGTCEKWEAKQ